MPYQTRATEVIAQWRAIERALAGVDAGTPESDDLRAEALRLRDEYQELILAGRRNDAPEATTVLTGYRTAGMTHA